MTIDLENDTAATKALEMVPASKIQGHRGEIELSMLMAKSSLLPKHLHGNPGNCLAVLMLSRDWNMNPIAVGLKTSVIPTRNGETLMFEGQLVNAVINKSKQLIDRLKFDLSGTGAQTSCTVTGTLKNESEPRTVTVGMPTIQNSPLWKGTQQEKEQQLCYLGARVWCRRHLPEVLLGVYTPEDDFHERDDDYSRRQDVVASRVAMLENSPSAVMPETQAKEPAALELMEDEFTAPARAINENEISNLKEKEAENRALGARHACATCGDTGEAEGEPCFICKPKPKDGE